MRCTGESGGERRRSCDGGESLDNLHGSAARRTLPGRVNGQRGKRWRLLAAVRMAEASASKAEGVLLAAG